jgi:general secretion pathway protein D
MGGLLEDRTGDNNQSVPGISKLPGIGNLFQNKSEKTYKTEFVVFIRAKIIKDPSIYGDYSDYRRLLPDSDFIVRDQENNILPPKQEDAR